MTGFTTISSMLLGSAALALAAAASPSAADEIYPEEWNQMHDLTLSALGADQLGGVVAQPFETAWQQIDIPTTEELSDEQKSELNQLKTGTIEYVVEIPPEEREEGGPTHRIVTAPAPYGGLDDMIETLSGMEDGLPGSQFQSANIGDLSAGGFAQHNLGSALGGNSALMDALTGFQP